MALAIMCSGGDAAGMNPAIKRFVDYVYACGKTPYLVFDGLEGLIDGNIRKAEYSDVAGIMHLGGTIIRSSRSKRFFEKEYREQAFENLQKRGIDALIVLGGDGSFRALDVLHREFAIPFVGIPTTIDNDIYGTEYCLGVDTALNVIRDAIDKIKDTAASFNRAFVVETMGRECGYLAAVSAMVSGAEICVIPEKSFAKEQAKERLQKEMASGRRYLLAVVAEGVGTTQTIKEWIEEHFELETRITVLGHIQRGGSPTVFDRKMAFEFILKSIDHLLQRGDVAQVIGYNGGVFSFLDIEEVVGGKYRIPQDILESLDYLD